MDLGAVAQIDEPPETDLVIVTPIVRIDSVPARSSSAKAASTDAASNGARPG